MLVGDNPVNGSHYGLEILVQRGIVSKLVKELPKLIFLFAVKANGVKPHIVGLPYCLNCCFFAHIESVCFQMQRYEI